MAPEQFKQRSSFLSDQYALGIIVYEWLSGNPPFYGDNLFGIWYQHTTARPESLQQKLPSLSPYVEHVVMTALAKDPAQRFGSIQAFARALEQAAQQ